MYKIIGADGSEYGPVTGQQVLQWIADGRANAVTRVKLEGATEWKNLAEFPEFAAALGAKPALPPQTPPAAFPPPVAMPVDPEAMAQKIIAGGVDFRIGDCFSRGWELVKADFWVSVGGCAVLLILLGSVGIIAGPLIGGGYVFFLKRIRGQKTEFGDFFAGFTLGFLPLFLCGLVSGLLTTVGIFLCIIPGIYLMIAWWFALPLVVDKKLDFWPAMEVSRKVVNKIWWRLFGFYWVGIGVSLLGYLACCVGIFVAWPVLLAASACAYESIFNRASQPAA
jgi:hypothetical protein